MQGPSWGISKVNFQRFFRKAGHISGEKLTKEPISPKRKPEIHQMALHVPDLDFETVTRSLESGGTNLTPRVGLTRSGFAET